jgi:hypothetical protein
MYCNSQLLKSHISLNRLILILAKAIRQVRFKQQHFWLNGVRIRQFACKIQKINYFKENKVFKSLIVRKCAYNINFKKHDLVVP